MNQRATPDRPKLVSLPMKSPPETGTIPARQPALASRWPALLLDLIVLALVTIIVPKEDWFAWACVLGMALHVVIRGLVVASDPAALQVGGADLSDKAPPRQALAWLVDAVLWTALLLAMPGLKGVASLITAVALAGSILSKALLVGRRFVPPMLVASWALPIISLSVGADQGLYFAFALVVWVVGVIAGTNARAAMQGRFEKIEPVAAPVNLGSTRRGVQMAIQAAQGPMLALHNGFVFELNLAAAELLGLRPENARGKRLADLAVVEPVDFFNRLFARRDVPETISLTPFIRMPQVHLTAHLNVGQSTGGDTLLVMSLEVPAPVAVQVDSRPPAVAPAAPLLNLIDAVTEGHAAPGRVPEVQILGAAKVSEPDAVAVAALPEPVAMAAQTLMPDLLGHLPMLAWVVDQEGRIQHTHQTDVKRWGMRIGPERKPRWWDAFAFRNRSRESFLGAMRSALAGRPTYDLFVERASQTGGRLALRSHVVPIDWPAPQGGKTRCALVLDTIASVRELLEFERLRRRKDHYKALVEASPNLIWSCDENLRFTFVSRRASVGLYGYQSDELIGVSVGILLNPADDQTQARAALVGLREGKVIKDVLMTHVTKDGRRIHASVSAAPIRDAQRGFKGAMGLIVDMTALKERETSLAEALSVERSVLDSTGQALAVVRADRIVRCNDAFLALLNRSPEQVSAARIADFFEDRGEWSETAAQADRAALDERSVVREIKVWQVDAESPDPVAVWCQLTLRSTAKGEYVAALADIDSIRRREAHALFDAQHDELTGLANRRLFADRAGHALVQASQRHTGCTVIVIDLDRFKIINDTYGHLAGDEVLQEMAHRLQRVMRPPDTVARYGGDEFAVLIPNTVSRRDVEAIARRLLEECARPVHVSGRMEECLSASIGIAISGQGARDTTALLSLADRAMYEAKVAGGNQAVFAPMSDLNLAGTGKGRGPVVDHLMGPPPQFQREGTAADRGRSDQPITADRAA